MQEFDVIQVLFKESLIFQRFDWYNSHSQGESQGETVVSVETLENQRWFK